MVGNEALIREIEAAAGRAWPAARTAPLAGWLLRAGPTATRRENSVRTLDFSGGMTLDDAIAAATAWYAGLGRPACFQLNPASRPASLDDRLAALGYRMTDASTVLLRPLATLPAAPDGVVLEGRPTALAMQAVADPFRDGAERAARAALFARIRHPLAFAVAVVGDEPVAGGLCVVDGPLAGLAAMRTAAFARRRGHGRAVLDRLLLWAARMGAETAWLQVETDNAPARALYRKAGFRRLHDYHYRTAPA